MTADEFREAALNAGADAAEVERLIKEQRNDAKRGIILLTFEELLQALGEARTKERRMSIADVLLAKYEKRFGEILPLFQVPDCTESGIEKIVTECLRTGKPYEAEDDPNVVY